jgi:hypothetical protein
VVAVSLAFREQIIIEEMMGWLLRRGLDLCEQDKEATEALHLAIEKLMNESIFGQVDCSSNWQLPKKDDCTMGAIKLANCWAQRMVEHNAGTFDLPYCRGRKKCLEGLLPSLQFGY